MKTWLTWPSLFGLRRSTYNSVLGVIGCFFVTDSFVHFMGLLCLYEGLVATIEGCWRDDADET